MNNKTVIILFLSAPIAMLISYLTYKFYGKNIPPSIIGLPVVLFLILLSSIFNKDERS